MSYYRKSLRRAGSWRRLHKRPASERGPVKRLIAKAYETAYMAELHHMDGPEEKARRYDKQLSSMLRRVRAVDPRLWHHMQKAIGQGRKDAEEGEGMRTMTALVEKLDRESASRWANDPRRKQTRTERFARWKKAKANLHRRLLTHEHEVKDLPTHWHRDPRRKKKAKKGHPQKRCRSSTVTQSVVFDKKHWKARKALAWLKKHRFKPSKADVTQGSLRYRQLPPSYVKVVGSKPIKKGVRLILGCPVKGKLKKVTRKRKTSRDPKPVYSQHGKKQGVYGSRNLWGTAWGGPPGPRGAKHSWRRRTPRRDPSQDLYNVTIKSSGTRGMSDIVVGHVRASWLGDAQDKAVAKFGKHAQAWSASGRHGYTPVGEPLWGRYDSKTKKTYSRDARRRRRSRR